MLVEISLPSIMLADWDQHIIHCACWLRSAYHPLCLLVEISISSIMLSGWNKPTIHNDAGRDQPTIHYACRLRSGISSMFAGPLQSFFFVGFCWFCPQAFALNFIEFIFYQVPAKIVFACYRTLRVYVSSDAVGFVAENLCPDEIE